MIQKLIAIQNVGKLSRLNLKRGDWDGALARTNIIFAPNGSGKTTLSLILQSLKDAPDLLKKKATFSHLQSESPSQLVKLRVDGRTIEYKNDAWSEQVPDIHVFNIHFIESVLFTGSIQSRRNQQNLFEYLAGQEGMARRNSIDALRKQRADITRRMRDVKKKARKGVLTKLEKDAALEALQAERGPVSESIAEKNREVGLYAQKLFFDFVIKVNAYLEKFSRSMRLEKISMELDQRTTFYLQFGSNRVTFDPKPNGHEFRYTLSEGDKNALAFSVFLAQISFAPDPRQLIVVFDDPLTSLDSARRHLTIKELGRLGRVVGQLIVLTHDASFAADLQREVIENCLSLELMSSGSENWLSKRDHQAAHITGLSRDLEALNEFQNAGAQNQSELRGIARCIRPVLEGFVRIKYFDRMKRDQWLGDFISAIRKAPENDDLARLQGSAVFDDLCDVNDYSKRLHHSSPDEPESLVDQNELHVMVGKVLRLIKTL